MAMYFNEILGLCEVKLKEIEISTMDLLFKADNSIVICHSTLEELKKLVVKNGFPTASEEITFFKQIKVIPLSGLIYYTELRLFVLKFPKASKKEQQKYLTRKIRKTNRFFKKNIEFALYIRRNSNHLDHFYFRRGENPKLPLFTARGYYRSSEFSTSHDFLLARIRAFDRFADFLQKKVLQLQYSKVGLSRDLNKTSTLNWTASKVALTELIYAIYFSGSLNNGTANLKEITELFQNAFNLNMGDFYKIYSEIKARKKSKTKFLDELSTILLSKMNTSEK